MQNVVVIPFVSPPQAAGAAAPSTDGAFLLSFASEALDQPATDEAVLDPTGLMGGAPMPFSFGMPAIRPDASAAMAELAEAGRGQAGLPLAAGHAVVDLVPVLSRVGPETAAEVATTGPDEDGTESGSPLAEQNPMGGDGGFSALSPDPVAERSLVETVGTLLARQHDHPARALTPVVTMSPTSGADLVAGEDGEQGAWGLTAQDLTSSSEADRFAGPDKDSPAPELRGIADRVTGLPDTAKDTASARVKPGAVGAAEVAGETPRNDSDPLLAFDTGGDGATKAFGPVGHSGLTMPERTDREAELEPTAAGRLSASAHRMAQSLGAPWTTDEPPALPVSGIPDSLDIDQATEDSAGLMSGPHITGTPIQDPSPGTTREVAVVGAGFWERLLTGLSGPVPGDPSSGGSVSLMGADAGRWESPAGNPLPKLALAATSVTPAAVIEAASSLAVFARGQAGLAAPSADPGRESGPSEQALVALSLPGALPPGLSPLQTPASAPVQSPVPHVAAQISAALSQSADGTTELALSPEELGRVRLRLERDANHPDRMVVHITFERPETLDLFRRHAGELAEALREAGYAGADIGFGRQDSSADTPHQEGPSAGADYASAVGGPVEAHASDSSAPRRKAGASLDLRL